jgi:hypothetical protein
MIKIMKYTAKRKTYGDACGDSRCDSQTFAPHDRETHEIEDIMREFQALFEKLNVTVQRGRKGFEQQIITKHQFPWFLDQVEKTIDKLKRRMSHYLCR